MCWNWVAGRGQFIRFRLCFALLRYQFLVNVVLIVDHLTWLGWISRFTLSTHLIPPSRAPQPCSPTMKSVSSVPSKSVSNEEQFWIFLWVKSVAKKSENFLERKLVETFWVPSFGSRCTGKTFNCFSYPIYYDFQKMN